MKGIEKEKIESSSRERRYVRLHAKERKQPTKTKENRTKTNLYEIYDIEDEEDSKDNSKDEDVNVDDEEQTERPDENMDKEEEIDEENKKSESEQESPFKDYNSPNTSKDKKMVPCFPMRPT